MSETNTNSTNLQINSTSSGFNVDIEKEKKRQKIFGIIRKVIAYAVLTFFALFALFPFYWMLSTSLKDFMEARESRPTFYPHGLDWENYSIIFKYKSMSVPNFTTGLINTLIVGFSSTILGIIITVICAFAFAKLEFKGKNALFALMMATMMIPGELFTITNYVTVTDLGWRNTYIVLILPFLVSIFYIYLLRNAMKQVPDSLYKAAKVDGCGDVRYLIKVLVPLVGPTIFSITLLKFIGTWNSYIWPNLVNNNLDWQLISNWVSSSFSDPVHHDVDVALKMAASSLVTAPLLVLFLCFRKYIMSGVSKSGTKG